MPPWKFWKTSKLLAILEYLLQLKRIFDYFALWNCPLISFSPCVCLCEIQTQIRYQVYLISDIFFWPLCLSATCSAFSTFKPFWLFLSIWNGFHWALSSFICKYGQYAMHCLKCTVFYEIRSRVAIQLHHAQISCRRLEQEWY